MLHRMVLATLAIALTCWLASSSAGAASFDVAIFHTERDALAEAFKFCAAERWQSQQVLALGAAPTAIDPGEQYLALQNKTVDCALSVPNLVLSLKLHEVAPKLTALRQAVNLSILVMNRRTWRSISAQDQTTIGAVSTEARQRSITNMRAVAAKGLADLKGLGSDIYALNDAELKAMKEKMKPVFDKIAEGSGEAGKPFAEQLKPYW